MNLDFLPRFSFFKFILAHVHSPGLCFVGVLNKHTKRARRSKWKSFYALWTSIWREGENIWKRGKICNNVPGGGVRHSNV